MNAIESITIGPLTYRLKYSGNYAVDCEVSACDRDYHGEINIPFFLE